MKWLFKLHGELSSRQHLLLEILGIACIFILWFLLTLGENPMVSTSILPTPWSVFTSYYDLYVDNDLISNVCRSIGLNLAGYTEAVLIALPIGFIIGLYPFFRGTFSRPVDSFRYVPLTAVTGLFIIWFGLGTSMKVHFLAFGILIYLLPVVVQRIDELPDVYLKTVYTLGATDWQTIKTVYIPAVIARLSDDIRVLTAISWTYIIIAESLGSQGGIGALIWRAGQRQGRIDKVFALLIIIIVIGFLQDKLFTYLDKKFFPFKHQGKNAAQNAQSDGVVGALSRFLGNIMVWALLAVYGILCINEFSPILFDQAVLSHLFGDTLIVIHFYMALILLYKVYTLLAQYKSPKPIVAKA